MTSVRIRIEGGVADSLRRSSGWLRKNWRGAMIDACAIVQTEARLKHNFTTRSGQLSRSISIDVASSGLHGEVYLDETMAEYGPAIHDGSKPHKIEPKTKKALSFESGGSLYARRSVQHPGTKPDPFLTEALENKQSEIANEFDFVLDELAQRLNSGLPI